MPRIRPIITTAVISDPLTFRRPGPADIAPIAPLLEASVSRTCDYSLGGIYMWIDYFKYEYAIHRDTLFIKGHAESDPSATAFMLPVGAMPVAEAVEAVRCHCRATATAPLFSAVPADRLDELLDAAGGRADVVPLPDWADYLYDIGTLATLSGKRMMRKRNHFNRFIAANPDYRLQPLTEANSREALAFMTSAEPDDKPDFDSAAIALYEYDQSRHVLDHLEAYPFEGALLRGAGGEIAALAVGEVIGEVLYAHIEKMRHDVPGAGAAIMKLFCADMQRRHPALRYVNREEDCGDAGLRKAKLDLHPLAILHKYDVRLKD